VPTEVETLLERARQAAARKQCSSARSDLGAAHAAAEATGASGAVEEAAASISDCG